MADDRFVLVEDGHLHHYPAYEECNVDDARIVRRNLTQFELDRRGGKGVRRLARRSR